MPKPSKPYPEFPLWPHATGRWTKKENGRSLYFGTWDDPEGALREFERRNEVVEKQEFQYNESQQRQLEYLLSQLVRDWFVDHGMACLADIETYRAMEISVDEAIALVSQVRSTMDASIDADKSNGRGETKPQRRYKRLVRNLKSRFSCCRCGESHPATLDFHHIDGSTKTASVAKMSATLTNAQVLAEIGKCEVLCANCHRKHHWN